MNHLKLGFGTMRLPLTDPNDAAAIDHELLCQMVDTYLERGFHYFDTAWMYCGGKSEEAVGRALVQRHPRESYLLTDKLPAYYLKKDEDRDYHFNEQLRRTGAGYFDYYFIHNINGSTLPTFEKFDCFNWLRAKKTAGLVRHIGFSFHGDAPMLDRLLTEHPDMEIVQLQLNYLDWENPGVQSRACYEVARKHGKPIIVMEPVKGGTLAQVPEDVEAMLRACDPDRSIPSWAIRFAAGLEGVVMVLSGMSNMEQLLDNTGYMADFQPLTADEQAMMFRAAEMINAKVAVPCTGCAYCVDDCPKNIAIPKYFSLYNADLQEIDKPFTAQAVYYDSLVNLFGRPEDCISCGLCEKHCPQNLPIRQHLQEVGDYFASK